MKPVTESTPRPFGVVVALVLVGVVGPAVIGALPPALTTPPFMMAVGTAFMSTLLVCALLCVGALHGSSAAGRGGG